jgi:hypothetical protein
MLVCGFPPAEQQAVTALLKETRVPHVPVIFAVRSDGTVRLSELLTQPDQSGRDSESGLSRAIVLSGITEDELHRILAAYRQSGLPRPLWATLTPTSETWPLSELLSELEAERQAMEQQKQ